MDDQNSPLTELQTLLVSDLSTLYKLVNAFGVPVAEGDIRAASVILRRWLSEGLIGRLCNDLRIVPSFPVLNNKKALAQAAEDSNINYFLSAGVRLCGAPVLFFHNSVAPVKERMGFETPIPQHIMVSTREFINQPRVYFEGEFFTCLEIITFTANKMGGVHHDSRRNERQSRMQRASEFMTFGGPLDRINRQPPGELYLNVEPNGQELLSGFHLEIIAAASSFVHIHLNGQQLMTIPETHRQKSWFSRTFGNRKPEFQVYETKKAPSKSKDKPI
ncbi:hypothetical protein O9X94_23405 [Agrobacterium leguminum]|uniref:Uncharacterized protein n=1 Tax=Agrobacterium leguminum TaxID=2792015 RepID=A0A9X3KIS9_9HYPH|nr:hypothetical protein [Agrobacterium leguminum]MCZ7912284.1 hypothetical protein [Agrobacterium leguminum]